jgi:LacI family transcriptional regulator
MVSIKDVARFAGVSDKTVSRVVNREPNVRQETHEKVEEAIARLNYVPNQSARLVRTNRSRTIGIMTDMVSTMPYSGDIVRGVQDWARQAGRSVLITNTGGDKQEEARAWRTFLEHRIDGVIYATMSHRAVDFRRSETPITTVLVNCFSESDDQFAAIIPDDYSGSVRLTEHLLSLGHRRIGYMRLNPVLRAADLRLSAFRDTLRRRAVAVDESLVLPGMYGVVGQDTNVSFESTRTLLDLPEPPTAILCGNDEIAMQVYCAVLSAGRHVPDDVSIAGFDDFHTVSHGLRPALTTAALPYHFLGVEGARMLDALLQGDDRPIGIRLADCPLIQRQSTGPAPN